MGGIGPKSPGEASVKLDLVSRAAAQSLVNHPAQQSLSSASHR